jgi:hypothetical protein
VLESDRLYQRLLFDVEKRMTKAEMNDTVRRLLAFAASGEFVSELNGYEADEKDIPGAGLRVIRLTQEDESRPTALRIERDGECLAWATVDADERIIKLHNAELLNAAALKI